MKGTRTSVVSLTICLAMTNTSAFVLRVPKGTPPDQGWNKQATSSLDRPLGDDEGKMGASGELSRGGGHDDAEPKKDVLPRVSSPEGYSWKRSRSTSPLHVFKGVEPGTTEGGKATVPIVGGMGGVGGEDWEVAGVPQDGRMGQQGSGRVTTTPDALSPHHEFFWGPWSSTAAAHESVPTNGDAAGGQREASTDEPVMILEEKVEEKVNEALRAMILNALSGRPAFKTAVPEEAVNDAIGSKLHDAFSGRPASQAFSSRLAGGGGSEDGAAGPLREEPAVCSETESKSKTVDDHDDSRLPAADENVVRAASEVPADWSKMFHADNKAAVTRKAGNGRRRWMKNLWGRVRRKGM